MVTLCYTIIVTEWKEVPGYESLYAVSDTGLVKSFHRNKNGYLLHQSLKGKGYFGVTLSKNGKARSFFVHQLVCIAFLGKFDNGHEVRHLDGVKTNNNLSNLSWGTSRQNKADTIMHGRHNSANKTHCIRGHLLTEENNLKSKSKQGYRACLACHRAKIYLYKYPILDIQVLSDLCFEYKTTPAKLIKKGVVKN